MADPAHTIIIEADGNGFTADVAPPVPGCDFRATYALVRDARVYARGLARYRGFAIEDRTQEVGNG